MCQPLSWRHGGSPWSTSQRYAYPRRSNSSHLHPHLTVYPIFSLLAFLSFFLFFVFISHSSEINHLYTDLCAGHRTETDSAAHFLEGYKILFDCSGTLCAHPQKDISYFRSHLSRGNPRLYTKNFVCLWTFPLFSPFFLILESSRSMYVLVTALSGFIFVYFTRKVNRKHYNMGKVNDSFCFYLRI